jgi:hypothetical protein
LLLRGLSLLAIVATAVLLGLTAYIISQENTWLPPPTVAAQTEEKTRNEQAFFHGTIGTEVAPLPVLAVLPELFPEHFQPFGPDRGDWIRQFGFIPSARSEVKHPRGESLEGLPLGFTLSRYRPKTGSPSPVPFVGLACATCHTTLIRRSATDEGFLVVGTGNTALNLFAWLDAFQAALLDEDRLTLSAIVERYEAKTGSKLSLEQKAIVGLWLQGTRAKLKADEEKYDRPYGNGRSMLPETVPTGPVRTQPFRTLVRTLLHRPGTTMKVYTKIAPVYWQDLEQGEGQFDGGIQGLHRRSSGAALAAGATVQNMDLPEIADNINWASDYLKTLKGRSNGRRLRYEDVFPDKKIDPELARNGKAVYNQYCNRCHGHPETTSRPPPDDVQWDTTNADRLGKVVPLAEIGTDPERVLFRYYEEIPDELSRAFPSSHRFDFPRDKLRPWPPEAPIVYPPDKATAERLAQTRGYINKPLVAAFARGPYLHNASVLTLRELINLDERKPVFFRGENLYDADAVGLASPTEEQYRKGSFPTLYFRFDTRDPGNSNRGHDYPWPRSEVLGPEGKVKPEREKELRALLEYMKTF